MLWADNVLGTLCIVAVTLYSNLKRWHCYFPMFLKTETSRSEVPSGGIKIRKTRTMIDTDGMFHVS